MSENMISEDYGVRVANAASRCRRVAVERKYEGPTIYASFSRAPRSFEDTRASIFMFEGRDRCSGLTSVRLSYSRSQHQLYFTVQLSSAPTMINLGRLPVRHCISIGQLPRQSGGSADGVHSSWFRECADGHAVNEL